LEEILRGLFGLIETAGINEIDDAVGRLVQAVVLVWGEHHRRPLALERPGAFDGCRLVTRQAAPLVFLRAAAATRIVAPDLGHRASGGPCCIPRCSPMRPSMTC
jgi:hypothetical protein